MNDAAPELADRLRRLARQRLESLARAGVDLVPKPRPVPAGGSAPPSAAAIAAAAADALAASTESPAAAALPGDEVGALREAPPTVHPAPPAPEPPVTEDPMPRVKPSLASDNPTERLAALEVIADKVSRCTRCPVLVENRTQTVFGVGNPMARVVFFGEAPGADEDAQGEPFVGRAGQLLNKIIEACTFKREDVYIMNVIKCRPPNNRRPEPDEVANCSEYRERQFEIIRPEYIVCLGATAAQALLGDQWSIGKLRGKIHQYGNAKVIATYHPAYLLRNPSAKADVWEDMKMLMKDMGIPIPRRGGG